MKDYSWNNYDKATFITGYEVIGDKIKVNYIKRKASYYTDYSSEFEQTILKKNGKSNRRYKYL